MRKIFALLITAALSTGAYAQSNKEDVDLIQAMYGKQKKELIKEYMLFNAAESTAFWTVYDEFEVERKTLGRARIQIITDYVDNLSSIDDIKAAELAKRTLENNVALEKLNQKFFPKFSTAVGAAKAAKYMQMELYLQTAVKSELQEKIPLIDALDKTKQEVK